MTKVLVINSSILGDASASRALVAKAVAGLRARHPGLQVVERDVGAAPLPHLTGETVGALRRDAADASPAEKATRALSDQLIAEVMDADFIVIGSPMYNLGIHSGLKTWFDHVLRAGATFQYTANGPPGLVPAKPVLVVESRGGFYSEGPAAAYNAQEPHLRAVLGLMGLTQPTFVRAESLAMGPDAVTPAMDAAAKAVEAWIAALA